MKLSLSRLLGLAAAGGLLLAPMLASAQHGGYGGYRGGPYYGVGPHYRGGIGISVYGGYGAYGYYPGYYYGPGYVYGPPPVAYGVAPPVEYEAVTPDQAPAAFWYYCIPAHAYFPYVQECPGGWQAVPVQAQTSVDRPKAAPAGTVTYRLGDVLFASGRSELEPGAANTLATLLSSINEDPRRPIVIEGHTDATGRDSDNVRLSQNRADAVKQYLIEHGVQANRITATGKGKAGAVATNATAEGRQRNRRVDIIVG